MQKSVYFLDIDDCLIKTSLLGKTHFDRLSISLRQNGIQNYSQITQEFGLSFNILFSRHQGKILGKMEQSIADFYLSRLNEVEKPIIDRYGDIKRWSREAILYIAAERVDTKLNNAQLQSSVKALWDEITTHADFYPDALPFLKKLLVIKKPFYLITSSDNRLTLSDTTGLFHYDPQYSKKLKMERLDKFTKLGIPTDHIFIADPYDKPNPQIFSEALNFARKKLDSSFLSVMIGDSVKSDLLPAKKAGFEKLILLRRHNQTENIPEGIKIISTLSQL
ncbi:HAD hydrolase-like protein [Patescibacteria group bacterium]|nr:HAD hydrolase-like protein [Patescibacteria group bacterium]